MQDEFDCSEGEFHPSVGRGGRVWFRIECIFVERSHAREILDVEHHSVEVH